MAFEIKTDEQLVEWCDLNLENGVVHIKAMVNDFSGPLQFSPTKRCCHPKVRKRLLDTPSTPPLNVDPPIEPSQSTQDMTHSGNECAKKVAADDDELKVLSDSDYDSDLAASSDSEMQVGVQVQLGVGVGSGGEGEAEVDVEEEEEEGGLLNGLGFEM
ncbi:hypothetical protein EJB05_11137, partial [Eragrostis curvula]